MACLASSFESFRSEGGGAEAGLLEPIKTPRFVVIKSVHLLYHYTFVLKILEELFQIIYNRSEGIDPLVKQYGGARDT